MNTLRRWHRRFGLALAALWLVQALAGIALVFHWELDDAGVPGAVLPLDPVALGARVAALEATGARVKSVWSSAEDAERWDIHYVAADGIDRTARVDGAGHVLRDAVDGALRQGDGAWIALLTLHTKLFAGETGETLIAISGLLLAINLAFGLKLAWPRTGTWRRALLARPAGGTAARLYGWHRLAGTWLGIPALLLVLAGVLLAFERPVQVATHAIVAPPATAEATRWSSASGTGAAPRIDAGRAIAVALAAYPGATLSSLAMPRDDAPWYRVRVRAPGELPRIWGTTFVFVAAADGAVLRTDDARTTNAGRRFYDVLYPLHTGQIGGVAGRVLALAIGAWLVLMIVLGVRLYLARRAPPARRA